MNNYEWLLNMGGEERQAWFDAEHANDELAHENDDSREKLEADIDAIVLCIENEAKQYTPSLNGYGTREMLDDLVRGLKARILEIADRQAEITKNECREEHRKRLGELHDLLDEAAREREELAWRVEYNGELVEKVKRERNNLQYENDALKGRISQFAAHETAETDETDAAKEHMRDFVDSREKLEADARALQSRIWKAGANHDGISLSHIIELLDRQAAITSQEVCERLSEMLYGRFAQKNERIAELEARVDLLPERKCPGYEPENHRCRYHDTDFELTREEVCKLKREVAELQAERDELKKKIEWDYVSRQDFEAQHRTLCAVREQRDEAREQVDAMRDVIRDFRDERDEWKAKFEARELAYKQADAERKRYSEQIDELIAERDEYREKFGGALGAIEESGGWRDENRELAVERDYWKQQVQLCMDSAYPPNHSPERSYNPDVMGYPDRHGCTTPSTLVGAVIDGLRDELAAQYMALVKELTELQAENEKLKAEVIQYAKDCGECGTAMPKGVSWPRFSDGSLLRYGDIFLDGAGNPHECHCVEFIDPKTTGLGASTIIHGNRYGIGGEYDGVSYNLFKGETLERPTDERDEGLA